MPSGINKKYRSNEIITIREWAQFIDSFDIFHYTSRESADSITEERCIRTTVSRIGRKFHLVRKKIKIN